MWLILLINIIAFCVYFMGFRPMNYWKNKGIPFLKPIPFLGNMKDAFFQRRPTGYILQDAYNAFPDERYFGFYNFLSPILMVRDPELIKIMTVKEFDSFPEHRQFIAEGIDPFWNNNLFAMKGGQKWQDMRATLSPAFTGNKMRIMFGLMKDCAKQFTSHFVKQNKTITVEMKDAFTRFTNDVIATTAFGVTCDSLEEKQNEFYMTGREVTNFTGIRSLLFAMHILLPTLAKLFKVRVFSEKSGMFFTNIIKDTIKIRQEKGIIRPDMIHLLMEARKEFQKMQEIEESANGTNQKRQKSEITDEDIVAQALIFFFAGFDSVSVMLSFTAHELAVNPDIQEKLWKEIKEVSEKYNGDFSYDAIMEMKYLDMVLSETLRKWPVFSITDRKLVKPFIIQPKQAGEKPLYLEPGTVMFFPPYGLQRDPKYFPDPEKYDPERFNDENKHKVNQFVYLPFGTGPRNCIGSRFALLESKLLFAEIISKFEIIPVEKTQIPIKLDRKSLNSHAEKGFWLGLKPRSLAH